MLKKDNWLRCWFNSIDTRKVEPLITMSKTIEEWTAVMADVFLELYRSNKKGGWVAFEVREIKTGPWAGEHVVPVASKAGFHCRSLYYKSTGIHQDLNIWPG